MSIYTRRTLTDHAVESIKEYICTHKLSTGDKLPSQQELCQMLDVSTRVVREALKSLETLGLVHIRNGLGAYVSAFDYSSLAEHVGYVLERSSSDWSGFYELAEARKCLESGVVEVIIAKADEKDICALEAIIDRMQNAATPEESTRADSDFHKKLVGITQNPLLTEFCKLIDQFFTNRTGPVDMNATMAGPAGHLEIVSALRNRDADSLWHIILRHCIAGIPEEVL